MTHLRADGYALSPDYAGSDVVLVNTCGFLDSARLESLEAISEALAANGKVIVTGCLGHEAALIREKFPHVLAITGPQQYEQVLQAVRTAAPRDTSPYIDLTPDIGVKLTPKHYAYVKISEGCNHQCSFCIIPTMRGPLVSRPINAVLREAEKLVAAGTKELLIISQDTSAYGVDISHATSDWRHQTWRAHIVDLAQALGALGVWVRLHYIYPYPHVDDLIPLMAAGNILPYLDIPFQHASPTVLKAMRRPAKQAKTLERIAQWRSIAPEIVLRSTFIVGFPGETEADFEQLLEWLEQAQLDRVGCFKFEPVAGATANAFADPVPEAIKEERWHRFMQAQARISAAKLQRKVGTQIEVLIDAVEGGGATGRSRADAPEIDGAVHLRDAEGLKVGSFVQVLVEDADTYDLYGVAVSPSEMAG